VRVRNEGRSLLCSRVNISAHKSKEERRPLYTITGISPRDLMVEYGAPTGFVQRHAC
jgi:hypothetical protein